MMASSIFPERQPTRGRLTLLQNGSSRLQKIILDLGAVKEIAEVSVNGTPVGGILWKPPFQADVTSLLKTRK